jgi:hypothetical protein
MLAPGSQVPDATVWLAPREPTRIPGLVDEAPALFLLFLFAWAKSQ